MIAQEARELIKSRIDATGEYYLLDGAILSVIISSAMQSRAEAYEAGFPEACTQWINFKKNAEIGMRFARSCPDEPRSSTSPRTNH